MTMVSPLLLDSMRLLVLVGEPQAKIGRTPPERLGLGIPSKIEVPISAEPESGARKGE